MEKEKTLIDKIWDFLASVKLAVVIFFLISFSSMMGTFLEQGTDPTKNIIGLTKLFGESLAPKMYAILFKLGFMEMYHSWWFVTLLMLFAANITICSIDRLPRILKMVREPIQPVSREYLERISIKKTMTLKGKSVQVKDSVAAALKEIGFKRHEAAEQEGVQLYAEKGNFTRLGVYITHVSVLIILFGAIIGSFWGFNAFLPLNEGETSSVAYNRDRKPFPLGFEIRCDNFVVDFYDNRDTPKDYKSWLTVLKDGREVKRQMIEVNNPLTYEGVTFYQSSYGVRQDRINNGIFVFRAVSKDGESVEINPRIGDTFSIPGTSVVGRITDFSHALSFDRSGRPFTYSDQMVNPAVYIEFSESGEKKYSGWLLKRYPRTWNLPDGNRVEFLEYWGVEYTGMQVRKDPGVFVVYLGCLIMAAGLYIAFFMSHRRVWVHVTDEKNSTRIVIGASANKNRAAFERKIERLASIISASTKGEDK